MKTYKSTWKAGAEIVREFVEPEICTEVIESITTWRSTQERHPPQSTGLGNYIVHEFGVSPRQKTLHNYIAYNLQSIQELPTPFKERVEVIFLRLHDYWCSLTGLKQDLYSRTEHHVFRPQIIQYESGRGVFGKHVHMLLPQKVGLILELSRRGVHYDIGDTHVCRNNELLTDKFNADQGDLITFRYDLPHWIDFVDPHKEVSLEEDGWCKGGKWMAVLPYY